MLIPLYKFKQSGFLANYLYVIETLVCGYYKIAFTASKTWRRRRLPLGNSPKITKYNEPSRIPQVESTLALASCWSERVCEVRFTERDKHCCLRELLVAWDSQTCVVHITRLSVRFNRLWWKLCLYMRLLSLSWSVLSPGVSSYPR